MRTKSMKDPTKIKKAVSEDEDWAILPFDEAEDDKRWAKLIKETDQLEREVARHEAIHGKVLMNEPNIKVKSKTVEFEFGDLF